MLSQASIVIAQYVAVEAGSVLLNPALQPHTALNIAINVRHGRRALVSTRRVRNIVSMCHDRQTVAWSGAINLVLSLLGHQLLLTELAQQAQ